MRPRKAGSLKEAYAKYGDKVDIVVVEDLVKGDFTDALKDVSAVIHAATPVPGRENLNDILKVSHLQTGRLIPSSYTGGFQITEEGALNLVRQAVAAGVKHISFIGTVGTALDFTNNVIKAPLTENDWNPLTQEAALTLGRATLVYTVAKTQAEKALWAFAQEHPELNLTTSTPKVHLLWIRIAPDRSFSQPNEFHWTVCGRLHYHPWSSQ